MSNPFPPGPQGPQGPQDPQGPPQQPNQGWGQQPGQPQQGWGQQPGQPGQAGFPPGGQPGFHGGPPPPPPRSSKVKKIVLPIVGVIVLAVIGLVVKGALSKDAVDKAEPGDCVTDTTNKAPKIIDCDKPGAAFKVVAKYADTSDTKKCDTDENVRKGSVLGIYRTGSDKGLLCLTVTPHTTADSFDGIIGASLTYTPEVIAIFQDMMTDGKIDDDEMKQLRGEE